MIHNHDCERICPRYSCSVFMVLIDFARVMTSRITFAEDGEVQKAEGKEKVDWQRPELLCDSKTVASPSFRRKAIETYCNICYVAVLEERCLHCLRLRLPRFRAVCPGKSSGLWGQAPHPKS